MERFFSSGLAADLVAGLICIEALWLAWRHHRTGQGPRPVEALAMLGAGLGLVFALRCSLTGAPWPWVALWLSAAGLAHGLDLRQRHRR